MPDIVVVLLGQGEDADVDDLSSGGDVVVFAKFPVGGVKVGFGVPRDNQPFPQTTERGSSGYLAAVPQPNEALKTQPN